MPSRPERPPSGVVIGVDEVGRGPLAGPVVAAAVILRAPIAGLGDSKKIAPRTRERLSEEIRAGMPFAVAAASVAEIDRINILQATMLAMYRAVLRLGIEPDEILVDGNRAPAWPWPTRCVVGGDATVPVIGAASIIAKVARDSLMQRLALRYPHYGWQSNAGYGTAAHLEGIAKHGVCPHHRRSFAPVRRALAATA